MAMLGDVFLDVVYADAPGRSSTVTSKPIEEGETIADHVEIAPLVLNISGVVVGDDADSRLARLETMWQEKELLTYTNRVKYDNLVIERFNSDHGVEVRNGFAFSFVLRRVKIVAASTVVGLRLPEKAQLSKVQNKGRQQTRQGTPTPIQQRAEFLRMKGLE